MKISYIEPSFCASKNFIVENKYTKISVIAKNELLMKYFKNGRESVAINGKRWPLVI